MATYDAKQQDRKTQECFLCVLDPKKSCSVPQLEGRLVAAQERLLNGEKTPIVILDTGTERVELRLDENYYRSLIKELKARGDLIGSYELMLRVYHLPSAPETLEYKGKMRRCYTGNAYTLAVLEPDSLLNITDLNQAEYCARQYTLNRLIPSSTSAATIRGNLVHHCFKELLKEQDHGHIHSDTIEGVAGDVVELPETALAALHRHLDQALQLNSIEMALAGVTPEAMRADVAPHLESLARWYEQERNTLWDMPDVYTEQQSADDLQRPGNQVRAETFLLAPEIGLRGRLDLFWQKAGQQRLLELKTGGATGSLPKREHRWQVHGYHALLAVRRDSQMKRALATLLYSGTPGSAQAIGIPSTIREIQRVNERRNTLILSRLTGQPPAPPGPSRCTKCAMLEQCQQISELLQWQLPEPDPEALAQRTTADQEQTPRPTMQHRRTTSSTPEDRAFFAQYYRLLQLEGRAGEIQQALLWKLSVDERIERGSAIRGLQATSKPGVVNDGWEQSFRCTNTSELREGDEILLSDGNPITGEVVTGTILAISSEAVTVWTRELINVPVLIDRYDNDLVHTRTLQNLLRWQQVSAHQRDLVAGRVHPRFISVSVPPRADFNTEQNLAVERALQTQDYLLIHGPPGTGKTSVIAEIVKRLVQQGQRVMLAAFTNQAVDNMLKRLEKEGFQHYVRLGHERSVDAAVRPHLLKELLTTLPSETGTDGESTDHDAFPGTHIYNFLREMPVIASTTATWSSDKYTGNGMPVESEQLEQSGFSCDVAIIDEAGQLTMPAILGALRFARRFILVGDEKQLPPLVLSQAASEQGLSTSLFSSLKQLDDAYTQRQPMAISACVPLRVQYRMNKWIANFASTVFYEKQLIADPSVANQRLRYHSGSPLGEESTIGQALDPRLPLVFLDVREDAQGTEVKRSDAEARAIRELVAGLLARGIAPQEIGIIAPYRAQIATIRRHLFSADPAGGWSALPTDSQISVDTVDRFQGGERLVILMSFATTQEPELESPRREFLINPHRLNVALTRAQRKLILVGNVSALERLPIFSRLLTYCRSMNTLLSARQHIEAPR